MVALPVQLGHVFPIGLLVVVHPLVHPVVRVVLCTVMLAEAIDVSRQAVLAVANGVVMPLRSCLRQTGHKGIALLAECLHVVAEPADVVAEIVVDVEAHLA